MSVSPTAPLAAPYLADEHRAALRESARAFLSSRALIWVVGVATILIAGPGKLAANSFNHHHLATPFDSTVANVLVGPAARWDSVWFLGVAHFGYYRPEQTVFFPLYPALMAAGGAVFGGGTGANLIVAIVLSCGCALGALYLVYRLTALELGPGVAHNAVWIYAWLPAAFFLSAVYTEALFLVLSIGAFYAARTGRWWVAGVVGALAAATRNSAASCWSCRCWCSTSTARAPTGRPGSGLAGSSPGTRCGATCCGSPPCRSAWSPTWPI
jgi:mannosyltransferase PIG-V